MSFLKNLSISTSKGVRNVRRVFFPYFDPLGEALIQTSTGVVFFEEHMIQVRVKKQIDEQFDTTPLSVSSNEKPLPDASESVGEQRAA